MYKLTEYLVSTVVNGDLVNAEPKDGLSNSQTSSRRNWLPKPKYLVPLLSAVYL